VVGGINLVDTRQIVDPDWGLKLAGKVGRHTIGILSASDRAPGLREAKGEAKQAFFNVARLQRDFLQDSSFSIAVTDWRFGAASNTVSAVEGRIRLAPSTVAGGQVVRTTTRDSAINAEAWASYFTIDQWGRTWKTYFVNRYVPVDYRAYSGFVTRTGFHEQILDFGYEWRAVEDGRWWKSIWPYFIAKRARTPDGKPEVEYFQPALQVILAKNIQVNYDHSFYRETFASQTMSYQLHNWRWRVERFKRFAYYGNVKRGDSIQYDPQNPSVGNNLSMEHRLLVRPSDRFLTEWTWLKSRLVDKRNENRLANQDIVRNRTTFQLTRNNAFRSIVEYDTSRRQLGISFLYSYVPRPNSALYFGYNDLMYTGLDPAMNSRVPGWHSRSRTLFTKLSYTVSR
jgi:hypothetical protein